MVVITFEVNWMKNYCSIQLRIDSTLNDAVSVLHMSFFFNGLSVETIRNSSLIHSICYRCMMLSSLSMHCAFVRCDNGGGVDFDQSHWDLVFLKSYLFHLNPCHPQRCESNNKPNLCDLQKTNDKIDKASPPMRASLVSRLIDLRNQSGF